MIDTCRLRILCSILTVVLGLIGCQPSAATDSQILPVELQRAGSCGLHLPDNATPADKIVAVLRAEGSFVVAQDMDALLALWQADGQVIDARNTAEDERDDQRWSGTDALRHRYLYWVFPGGAAIVAPQDFDIHILDESAVVISTTSIDSEIAPGGDRWEVEETGGCWLIRKLTFNLER